MRLVSCEVDAVLQKPTPVNFGLYFNKFLEYHQNFSYKEHKKNKEPQQKLSFKPLSGEKSGLEPVNSPLTQIKEIYYQSHKLVNSGLRKRHLQQVDYCRKSEAEGYSVFIFHARLQSPYISGLGMSHPTETGMIFDHTLGVPYIPAAGQKGLLRLAYMLNDLKDESGNWRSVEQFSRDKNDNLCWEEDNVSRTLFGFSDNQGALAGCLQILDAYPLSQPELAEDILNPHYGDYYNSKGEKRGPTEDQSPVPVKYLTLKKGQEFVFRFLLRHGLQKAPAADVDVMASRIKNAMKTALTEEGFGAKTALGYGRFAILGENEPEKIQRWFKDEELDQQEKEKKRLLRIELEKYPWRPLLRKIEKIDNWGEFDLKVINSKWGKILDELELDLERISSFRNEKVFAEGVRIVALQFARKNITKWTDDRDKKVADWLASSPVIWESPLSKIQPETASAESHDNSLLQTITILSDWPAFQQANIKITSLDKFCADALKKKFSEWGCKKSKNENKKKAFKQLNNRLKKLMRE